ncbi:hypothetical protein GIB67_000433 [Kingdonia uniflora]|uniref:F-box domain-containing protein n=1 Tax=Kingdonia uniflora TaxID=39325 RepID=A0A7J7MPS9_9MAGN|nr:hypothetical protein GIB67_000433 [Kingdonia uniflora]
MEHSNCPHFASSSSGECSFNSCAVGNCDCVNEIPINKGEKGRVDFGKRSEYDLVGDGSFDRGGSSCEEGNDDIYNILPSDPFGMGISATLRITNELNAFLNKAMKLPPEPQKTESGFPNEKEVRDGSHNGRFVSICNVEEYVSINIEHTRKKETEECSTSCSNGNVEGPHDALLFSLGYLDLEELLSVEQVCSSLRDTVKNDTLLWKNVIVDYPLNEKITNDILLQLTNRAKGSLQGLTLMNSWNITNDGLKHVLDNNPHLTKLNVTGCTQLRIDCFIDNLKAFNFSAKPGLKHLRLGGIYGVTHKHFEELKSLVGADKCKKPKAHSLLFYQNRNSTLAVNDDRAIDLDYCPRCQNVRLIYDCPLKECQGKPTCRACYVCISRCLHCGRCIKDSEFVETFFLDMLCIDCWEQLSRPATSEHTIIHQEARYRIRIYGTRLVL